MRFFVALSLLCFAQFAHSEDLLCEGSSYFDGQTIPTSRVFSLDKDTLNVSVKTNSGRAWGVAQSDPELYMGSLYLRDGRSYWFNLNRYTGELAVIPVIEAGKYGTADFTGTCRHAERQF